jgi:serine protease Do
MMKISLKALSLIGGISMLPSQQALAIEPPPEELTPPAALLEKTEKPKINLPYLGISSAAIPEMLSAHLGLESGNGVIARTVIPDSPAAKAGISENDIILSLNQTPITSPEALSAIIREFKSGDRLTLELIRKGNPSKAEVTLSDRPQELQAELEHAQPFLQQMPNRQNQRLEEMLEENLERQLGLNFGAFPDEHFENTFRMMRERMNQAFEQSAPNREGGIQLQHNSSIRLMDNEGSLEIKSSEGKTDVTVRDTKNKVVWSGPWNTEKQKAAAPKEIRERIDRVHTDEGSGFSFRFGKRRSAPEGIEN